MPPPRPDVTDRSWHFFHAHATTIQIGFAVLLLVVGGAGVANGIVAYHMKRMTVGSVMAYGYIGAMAVGALPGCLLVAFCFLTAVYRPDRDPQVLGLLYDLGLLSYVGSLGCFSTAYFAFAVAILYDKNQIFPKWLAYVSIWQIVTEIMAAPVFISKAGPFAWNGSIAFWLGVVVFGFWLVCVIVFLKKANRTPASRRTTAGLTPRQMAIPTRRRLRHRRTVFGDATEAHGPHFPATAISGSWFSAT